GKAHGTVPRALGAASLDRLLEAQRVALTPEQRDEVLRIAPSHVTNPLPALTPTEALLKQEAGQDLAGALTVRYAVVSGGLPPLHEIAAPLWAKLGAAQMEAVADATGGHLALLWGDAQTACTLRLPFDHSRPAEFEISHRQGGKGLAQRT